MNAILVPKVTFAQDRLELIVPELSVTFQDMDEKRELLEAFSMRVNKVCDILGIPPAGKNRQAELGKLFGVTQKAARKWLVGEGFPDTAICIQMAVKSGVSFDWLMTGRGDEIVNPYSTDSTDGPLRRVIFDAETGPVGVFGDDLEELRKTLEAALLVIDKAASQKH